MLVNSIIIDNQTKAQRITSCKVQLHLVAMPLDEDNDTEPNMSLRLFINDQLLQNLQSDIDGYIKESIIIDNIDGENMTVELQDLVTGIKSEIRHIIVENAVEEQKIEPVDTKTEEAKAKSKADAEAKEEEIVSIKVSPQRIKNMDIKYRMDRDVVRYALEQDGLLLEYVGYNLKNDIQIVTMAMDQDPEAFKFV